MFSVEQMFQMLNGTLLSFLAGSTSRQKGKAIWAAPYVGLANLQLLPHKYKWNLLWDPLRGNLSYLNSLTVPQVFLAFWQAVRFQRWRNASYSEILMPLNKLQFLLPDAWNIVIYYIGTSIISKLCLMSIKLLISLLVCTLSLLISQATFTGEFIWLKRNLFLSCCYFSVRSLCEGQTRPAHASHLWNPIPPQAMTEVPWYYILKVACIYLLLWVRY